MILALACVCVHDKPPNHSRESCVLLAIAHFGQAQATLYVKTLAHIASLFDHTVLLELARAGQVQAAQYGKSRSHTAS